MFYMEEKGGNAVEGFEQNEGEGWRRDWFCGCVRVWVRMVDYNK